VPEESVKLLDVPPGSEPQILHADDTCNRELFVVAHLRSGQARLVPCPSRSHAPAPAACLTPLPPVCASPAGADRVRRLQARRRLSSRPGSAGGVHCVRAVADRARLPRAPARSLSLDVLVLHRRWRRRSKGTSSGLCRRRVGAGADADGPFWLLLSAGQQCSAPAEAEEDEDLQLRLRLREAFSELLDDPAALLADVRPCGPPDSRLARASQTLAQCRPCAESRLPPPYLNHGRVTPSSRCRRSCTVARAPWRCRRRARGAASAFSPSGPRSPASGPTTTAWARMIRINRRRRCCTPAVPPDMRMPGTPDMSSSAVAPP
jgi:hypothetical protein